MPSGGRRLVVIALDGFSPQWLERFLREGALPAIWCVMRKGTFGRLVSTLPATTPVAWTTAMTGCDPARTGITASLLHRPGQPLDERVGCYAHRCNAEPVWETATLNGLNACVVKFPVSYPSRTAGLRIDGAAGWGGMTCLHEFAPAGTAYFNDGDQVHILSDIWTDEAPTGVECVWTAEWIISSQWPTGGYCRLLLAYCRVGLEYSLAVATDSRWEAVRAFIKRGEWSEPLIVEVDGRTGPSEYCFRLKLEGVGEGPEELRLIHTGLHERRHHSHPSSRWDALLERVGPIEERTDPLLLFRGEIDLGTQFEFFELNADWLRGVAREVLREHKWDLILLHVHFLDWAHHMLQGGVDSRHPDYCAANESLYTSYLRRSYELADGIVAEVLSGTNTSDNIMVLGDHGQDLHHTTFRGNECLHRFDLLRWNDDGSVDWSATKAYGAGNFFWVNLRQREPTGIVEPSEFDAVLSQIAEALGSSSDPVTGQKPLLRLEPASAYASFGVDDGSVGDLIAICESGYQLRNDRGPEFQRTRFLKEFTSGHDHSSPLDPYIESRVLVSGPAFRRAGALDRAIPIRDVAPTICRVLEIPPHPGCQGEPMMDLLEPTVAAMFEEAQE